MSESGSTELNIALVTLSGLVMVLGLLSGFIKERLFLSEPMVAVLAGALIGPSVLGFIDLASWGKPETILEQGSRLAIAMQVMGVALQLPKGYIQRNCRPLAVLLGLAMPLMWLSSGLLAYLILGLPFWEGMLLGAIVTPTDPILSSSVVTGKVAEQNLPANIRHTLSAESGANDGLAYLLVLLPILLLTQSPGEALSHWFTKTLLWEVVGALPLGALMGYAAGRTLIWAETKQTTEKQSFLAYTIALALATLGAVKLLGSDGILAVFVAGVTFDLVVSGSERAEESGVQQAIDRFFTLYVFVLLGLALPWEKWLGLGWHGLLLVVTVLLLRRIPALLVLKPLLPRLRGTHDALFVGWFGPIGVAALYYAVLSQRHTGLESTWVVGSLLICGSIFAHGITAVPLAKLYGNRVQSTKI